MTRRKPFVALAALTLLAACSPKLPEDVDSTALNDAVGRAIGSGSTCVLIADQAGHTVWRGGGYITCARTLPTCGGATSTAPDVLKAGLGKPARFVSCPSPTGGANTVGWAMGPVPTAAGKPDRGLYYVAVMEGERALPGREVQDRVEAAFAKAGL
ncbi:MAG: hypothetical protein JWP92_3256 [Caulobacter sp.]|nr:hypothetical protein [Caulobacter sp.]